MNKIRRQNLKKICDKIEIIKCELEEVLQQEEDYRDSIPDNLIGSKRYEKAEEACDYLEEACDYLEDIISNINYATE